MADFADDAGLWGPPAPARPARGRLGSGLARLLRRRAESSAALSYRFLARQIDADLPREGKARTVLLSSPVPAASSNEAISLFSHALAEELSCRVLLVDGTFGDAGVGAMLGHAGAPGLLDLVHDGDRTFGEVVQPTPRRGIDVLPAGRTRVSRLLPIRADRVAAFHEQARSRYDFVLVQQRSIASDTRYLLFAAVADLVLLLAEEGVTFVGDLDRCFDVFRGHQIGNVRLMLCAPR